MKHVNYKTGSTTYEPLSVARNLCHVLETATSSLLLKLSLTDYGLISKVQSIINAIHLLDGELRKLSKIGLIPYANSHDQLYELTLLFSVEHSYPHYINSLLEISLDDKILIKTLPLSWKRIEYGRSVLLGIDHDLYEKYYSSIEGKLTEIDLRRRIVNSFAMKEYSFY